MLRIPFDLDVKSVLDIPYTISYVIKKRKQIDSFSELPQEKRPPEHIIWSGNPKDLSDWFDKVFKRNKKKDDDEFYLDIDEVEG